MADDEEVKQRHARAAISEFVQRAAVYLVPGTDTDAPSEVGSGIAVLTPQGNVTVLTAWHIAKDMESTPHRLGYQATDRGVNDVVRGVIRAPRRSTIAGTASCEEDVDVALVLLSNEAQGVLASLAISTDNIATDDVVDPERDVVVLSGYPFYLSGNPPNEPKSRFFSHIHYTTGVHGRDGCGRLLVAWDEAVVEPGDALPPQVRITPGEIFKLGHPGGISGGAVWRFRGSKKGELLWSATTDGQVIGVPVSWDKTNTEFAESCCLWREWLVESLVKADEQYSLPSGANR